MVFEGSREKWWNRAVKFSFVVVLGKKKRDKEKERDKKRDKEKERQIEE